MDGRQVSIANSCRGIHNEVKRVDISGFEIRVTSFKDTSMQNNAGCKYEVGEDFIG